MRIGDMAKLAECKVVTVRYYEKLGLMPKPERTGANYRTYTREDAERLKFIRHCRRHGIPLKEVEELLNLSESGGKDCKRAHEIIRGHLEEINRRIEDLQALKESLKGALRACEKRHSGKCEALRSLRMADACEYCQRRLARAANDANVDE